MDVARDPAVRQRARRRRIAIAVAAGIAAAVLWTAVARMEPAAPDVDRSGLTDVHGHAERTMVGVGRSSVNTIEILSGLSEGAQVVLSDMSAWDGVNRVRVR